jgi:hypothetical protein
VRIVAVTRILNEDDIVEAFVRHHAVMVDHHLFLDNGSTDRTLDILRSLQAEGLKLTVLQNAVPFYTEVAYNTNLFKQARGMFSADWVFFLDADEFIDARHAPNGLRWQLAALNGDVNCLSVPLNNYMDLPDGDSAELNVTLRMRSREVTPPTPTMKMFVAGSLADMNAVIEAGQHDVTLNGQSVIPFDGHGLTLAHYFRRSGWQAISKAVLGRLKVIAAGAAECEKRRSSHYTTMYETMRDEPEKLLNPGFMSAGYGWLDLVDDPLSYLGGPLLYTQREDPKLKAVRSLIAYAEQLAAQHGLLIDTNEGVRIQTAQAALTWRQLF